MATQHNHLTYYVFLLLAVKSAGSPCSSRNANLRNWFLNPGHSHPRITPGLRFLEWLQHTNMANQHNHPCHVLLLELLILAVKSSNPALLAPCSANFRTHLLSALLTPVIFSRWGSEGMIPALHAFHVCDGRCGNLHPATRASMFLVAVRIVTTTF